METIFRLKTTDLDNQFLTVLRTLFRKREIEITVTDVVNDETDFLLKDTTNKKHLLEAIEEVKTDKKLVRFSGEEFKNYCKSLSGK